MSDNVSAFVIPDGSQVLTESFPSGFVFASWRASANTADGFQPIESLGGSVEVAP